MNGLSRERGKQKVALSAEHLAVSQGGNHSSHSCLGVLARCASVQLTCGLPSAGGSAGLLACPWSTASLTGQLGAAVLPGLRGRGAAMPLRAAACRARLAFPSHALRRVELLLTPCIIDT